jgi:hypothetical protein
VQAFMVLGKNIIHNLKNEKAIFLLILFCNNSFAQSKVGNEFFREELNTQLKKSWDSIVKDWSKKVLWVYIRQQKIKISDCSTCGIMYIYAHISINSVGKCTYTKGNTGHCLKDMPLRIEKRLMQYFLKITFPPHLRNIIIVERLGEYLKC